MGVNFVVVLIKLDFCDFDWDNYGVVIFCVRKDYRGLCFKLMFICF